MYTLPQIANNYSVYLQYILGKVTWSIWKLLFCISIKATSRPNNPTTTNLTNWETKDDFGKNNNEDESKRWTKYEKLVKQQASPKQLSNNKRRREQTMKHQRVDQKSQVLITAWILQKCLVCVRSKLRRPSLV